MGDRGGVGSIGPIRGGPVRRPLYCRAVRVVSNLTNRFWRAAPYQPIDTEANRKATGKTGTGDRTWRRHEVQRPSSWKDLPPL